MHVCVCVFMTMYAGMCVSVVGGFRRKGYMLEGGKGWGGTETA